VIKAVSGLTQADDVVRLARDVLGGKVLGAYLHGSAVLGGLQHDSDVDVLLVLLKQMSDGERRRLVDGLLDISGRRARLGPARPVELTGVVQADVRPWRFPPRSEFQYGEWLRDEYERGELPAAGPSPDLAPLITMALHGNRPLFGPPPAELLDPVPLGDLRRAIVEGLPDLLGDLDSDTRNVVLTLARIWSTLATGQIRPKDAAADWVLVRLPPEHRPVLAHARSIYLGDAPERWEGLKASVRPHAEHVVTEIRRLSDSQT
jgi:predicted nucleotidyltransferase